MGPSSAEPPPNDRLTPADDGAASRRLDDPTAELRRYLDASPSPWHAVHTTTTMLDGAGYTRLDETEPWVERPEAAYVVRGGAVVAFRGPNDPSRVRVVGAHTDSPCLRVRPHPDVGRPGWNQLGVEVYGGVLANSWLDRDLGVAGVVRLAGGGSAIVDVPEPVARVPQLAIHLDPGIRERGLLLDLQQHLTPVWGTGVAQPFTDWLAEKATADDIVGWDLCLYDVQPAAVLGADASMLASGRLDNLVSCWAATLALLGATETPHATMSMISLFDHEEVGSASTTGAAGPFLEAVLERVVGGDRSRFHQVMAASSCVSADNAHAIHPNYPERHEANHAPLLNRGPVVKVNANQRYATSAATASAFRAACDSAGVPWQTFSSRNNMPCGSTIGPLTATRLGIPTVDVGVPQLSMHSAREVCGTFDPLALAAALSSYFAA